ncbi:MAG: SRPBCC domain-containing protein [Propionicimonas sp.]|nr:SRPBCC domain-containing protein [Propionicimonas sp.]
MSSETADREIVVSRTIDAPREVVFDAFTEVRHLSRWWGPDGFTTTTRSFEFSVGGEWSFVMHGPDGTHYPEWIRWREIVPPQRIAFAHGEFRDDPNSFDSTLTFEQDGDQTRIVMSTVFPTRELRDEAVEKYHAIEGGQQTLGNLASYVAGLPQAGEGRGHRTSRVRVHNFSVSLDGFGVGEGQRLEAPFGHAGTRLLDWALPTRTFMEMGFHGEGEGTVGVDEAFASQWNTGIGVEIMGRNKFAPKAGPWPDDQWRGWWGDNPPFHTPVIVLTHHPRPPLEMDGGTTFYFINATPVDALRQARELAGGLDVRIGGGVTTVRQFLQADLVDELHLAVAPVLLGGGERLWDGLEGLEQRFHIEPVASPSGVVHLTFSRRHGEDSAPPVSGS